MPSSLDAVKELREQSGAGIMSCKKALEDAGGDMQKALQLLKEQNLTVSKSTLERVTSQGRVECYVHHSNKVGAMVEINCETDFVARTDEFKALCHNIAMQVAALSPQFLSKEEIPSGTEAQPEMVCLLAQAFIKDPTRTVQDIVNEVIGKTGENVRIKRFVRFELGL